jgi:predicted amidophosphoribosyltransferase
LEYTPRQGPQYGDANNLIMNLKKPVDRRGRPEYFYKERAIQQSGDLFRAVLNPAWIETATLVPVPCSKTRQNPLYDDRIERVLQRMRRGLEADIRELVVQNQDLESFHGGSRLRPAELAEYYDLNFDLCEDGEPTEIAIFDDLLTTGSHFKAMEIALRRAWPDVAISGIFIARRYIVNEDIEIAGL